METGTIIHYITDAKFDTIDTNVASLRQNFANSGIFGKICKIMQNCENRFSLMSARDGSCVECIEGDEIGKSSPKQHCPQKADAAQAATAASNGNERSSDSMSWVSILPLIGGLGGRLELLGDSLWSHRIQCSTVLATN